MPKTIARNYQCLLIEADGRNFFTHEEHLPQLLEFCKSFEMSMSVVKVDGARILDISELPKAVCDSKETPKTEYSLIRKIIPFDPSLCVPLVRSRNQILETAKAVREKIHERFSKGEAVSKNMLEEEFPEATITSATFMQHVRNARKELEAQGYQFERIAPGCYRSITPEQQKKAAEEKKALQATPYAIWTKVQMPKIKWGPPKVLNYITGELEVVKINDTTEVIQAVKQNNDEQVILTGPDVPTGQPFKVVWNPQNN